MRKVWMIFAALSGVASAGAGEVQLAPGPFRLPDRIGPLALEEEPHKYDDPRLGVSYQYGAPNLSLTVYVFDAGYTDIPDGPDNTPACEAYEAAKADVLNAGYEAAALKTQQLARLDPPAEWPTVREAVFEFKHNDRPTISYLWITGAAHEFVKLRFSADASLREELPDARRAILAALGAALKPQLQPPPAKAAGAAPEKATSIVIDSNTNPDDMGVGFMYLMLLTSLADQQPQMMPVCGGPLVPDFATEVGVYRGVLEMGAVSRGDKLAARLKRIADAGFLAEYVWSLAHRETWGTQAPEDLKLDDFARWRKKNLRNFKPPAFGYIEVRSPRPLPLEPAP